MHKRGLTYIDWVISMGTFIIMVLAIFVFFKPGAQPIYDHESLLDIVETHFFQDYKQTIVDIPVFVKRLQTGSCAVGSGSVTIKVDIFYALNYSMEYSISQGASLSVNHLNLSVPRQVTVQCPIGVCRGRMDMMFKSYNKEYPNPQVILNSCACDDQNLCKVSIGASEFLEGIDKDDLGISAAQGYESLKSDWDFPQSKNFAVKVNNQNLVLGPEPPQQGNVFTRTKKYWEIRSSGERAPIDVVIQVW